VTLDPARAHGRRASIALALLLAPLTAHAAWWGHARDAQHTALSSVPSQPLQAIHWQMPVDLQPQYSGTLLLIHYGSPLFTEANTVLVPVKTGASDGFRLEARAGADGTPMWQFDTDYSLPPHNWIPAVGPVVTPQGRVYMPGAGGTLLWTDDLDIAAPHVPNRVAFYGNAAYEANKAAMDASLKICTPLTSGDDGTVWFGVRAVNTNPLGIASGLACVDRDGVGRFVAAIAASGGLANQFDQNCAPALSRDGALVYIAGRANGSTPGYLLALRTADLTTRALAAPADPLTGFGSTVHPDGTSSPMVAPDGRVFFGVLGTPFGTNASRGWMMQYDSVLVSSGAPGAFGWDITPSLVPADMIPSYTGSSPYLIMTKYNFYASSGGGDGVNKLAVLDPDDTQVDSFSGVTVMKEVAIIAGITPDPDVGGSFPDAVKEWCVNTCAVDPFTRSVLAASEDGYLYRWDPDLNVFTESIQITEGIGEAYTPSMIGPDGQVYAINNATLYAIGATNVDVPRPGPPAGVRLAMAGANPGRGDARVRFSVPATTRVTLEVLDVAGRRLATLWDADAAPGDHVVTWDGRDADGAPVPAGMHFVRLRAAGVERSLRLLRLR